MDLGPLVVPDAATDAGGDACADCDAADGADVGSPCPSDEVKLPSGRCCPSRFSSTVAGADPAGLLLNGEEVVIYGTKDGRVWAARLDRCDGRLLQESTTIVSQPSAAYDAVLSGDRLVLAGRVGTSATSSGSLVAWGSASTLSQFEADIGSTSPPSQADAVVVAGGDQAWVAATARPTTGTSRALLRRVLLDFQSPCVETLGGDLGSGQAVAVDGNSVWLANIQGAALYMHRAPLASCFMVGCDCGTSTQKAVAVGNGVVLEVSRMLPSESGVLLVASTVEDFSPYEGGGVLARLNESFTVTASRYFGPSGAGVDRFLDLDASSGQLIVGGAWQCSSSAGGQSTCSGGRVLALPTSFNSASSPSWERNVSELERVTGVKVEPEAKGGLLLVGRAQAAAGATLMRCGADGLCGGG